MTQQSKAIRINANFAQKTWGKLPQIALRGLEELTSNYSLSVASGDLFYLDGKWYVTHPGLLRVARRSRCAGIRVEPVQEFCDPQANRWVFKATVYKSRNCKGFVGYGDADPSNVSPLVRGAEMRVAETRAVNRALRKAYGIGLCSVEELGWSPNADALAHVRSKSNRFHGNGTVRINGPTPPPRPALPSDPPVQPRSDISSKAYAAHFCGTETLKDASRDLVESFISHLAASAKEDSDGLICKLNSYSQPVEVKQ